MLKWIIKEWAIKMRTDARQDAQDNNTWPCVMNTIMNFQFYGKWRNFYLTG
jgi:hypothetical protein